MNSTKLIVALDFPSAKQAYALADQLSPDACRLKVGKELFTREGPAVVRGLQERGFDLFLDLKFHDIPATVAAAVVAAAELGVWMVNVHATGGAEMMRAAVAALQKFEPEIRPLLIGVTVLTSMSEAQLQAMGVSRSLDEQVLYLAKLAQQSGLDGVVCSAREASVLKSECGKAFRLVTPGIRPLGSSTDDQSRIMTPKQAILAGSDFLVVGRPITASGNPLQMAQQINQEIASAFE